MSHTLAARLCVPALLLASACSAPMNSDGIEPWMPHAAAVAEVEAGTLPGSGPMAGPPYVPLRAPGDRPDVTVYGYWPSWGDPLSTVPWDQLTHVAVFSVDLRSDGTLGATSNWTANAATAMSLAAPYGVSVHLCVTSFDDAVMNAVLSSPALRTAAISQLADLVDDYGAHGVNVDFEGLDAHLKQEFVAFVQELSAAVDEVYVAMPAVDWNSAYDFDELAFASDGLFIMGYDYHWSGGSPGPVAPLDGGATWGAYDLMWTLNDYRTWGAPDTSIVMGLPLYGRHWETTSNAVPGTSTGTSWAELYASAVPLGSSYGRHYDASAATAYAFPDSTSQLWYDDDASVAAKVSWALGEGVQGVGFWALTYDDADASLWAGIDALTHDGVRLEAPTPGVAGVDNTFVATGAVPGETVHFAYGLSTGSTPVPGCPTEVQLAGAAVLGSAVADGAGRAALTLPVSMAADGRTVHLQAVQLATCDVSNLVSHDFGGSTPTVPSACYPGPAEDYSACWDVVPAGGMGPDYAYPAPIGSNYQEPTRYLDLVAMDPAAMVAPNFRLDELAQEWKGPYAVVQVHAVERLQELRDALGALVINSGYRSPAYNASVGGASASRHMYGDAFDIDPVSATLTQLEAECYARGAGYVGMYVSHVHCDWRDDAQEAVFFGSMAPPPPPVDPPRHTAHIEGTSRGLRAPSTGWDCGEPLREWTAWDDSGRVLAVHVGAEFEPPEGTAEVEVLVGGNVRVRETVLR